MFINCQHTLPHRRVSTNSSLDVCTNGIGKCKFNFNRFQLQWPFAGSTISYRMVVEFITTYAFSAYHHWYCEFGSRSGRGVQHYVIKFVSVLRHVGGFLRVLWFPPPIKLRYNITEILLKLVLSTIYPTYYWTSDIVMLYFQFTTSTCWGTIQDSMP
jgi:hypothetical protein